MPHQPVRTCLALSYSIDRLWPFFCPLQWWTGVINISQGAGDYFYMGRYYRDGIKALTPQQALGKGGLAGQRWNGTTLLHRVLWRFLADSDAQHQHELGYLRTAVTCGGGHFSLWSISGSQELSCLCWASWSCRPSFLAGRKFEKGERARLCEGGGHHCQPTSQWIFFKPGLFCRSH